MSVRIFYIAIFGLLLAGCATRKNFTADYYRVHEKQLIELRKNYQQLYKEKPFSMEMKDKQFKRLALEIITDSIKYIYTFNDGDARLTDTLHKYGFNSAAMLTFIKEMQAAQCTWITNLDYYEQNQRKQLGFVSIRHKEFESKRSVKYFTLAFFDTPQPFDDRNRLLDKDNKKNMRSINGEIFYKINPRVFYTFPGHFR